MSGPELELASEPLLAIVSGTELGTGSWPLLGLRLGLGLELLGLGLGLRVRG